MAKQVCALCRTTGPEGARWLAFVDSDKLHVHQPCGQRLIATAPKGVKVKIIPSAELRREWQVQAFWREKFATARDRAAKKLELGSI